MAGIRRKGVSVSDGRQYYLTTAALRPTLESMSPEDFQATLDLASPFRVYLADGRTHDVVDSSTVQVGMDGVLIGLYGEGQRFPRWKMIALRNIVSIEPLTAAQLG
jgi:hypothetical protein